MIERPLSGRAPLTRLPKGAVDTQMHMYLPGFSAQAGGPPLPGGALPDAGQYRRLMAWLGIDRVIITQGNAHQRDNSNLLACLADMGPVARGVAAIAGEEPDGALDALAGAGVAGARIMDLPGGAVGLAALEAVDARASARGWMVAVQFDGSHILEHEARLKRLRSRWVLDHHGKFFGGVTPDSPEVAAVRRLIDGGNCWFKFAGAYESSRSGGPDYADVAAVACAIAAHAPERIVWGTNWPHNLARTTESYPDDAALTDTVLGWLPDEEARRLALVDNPERLFGLPPFATGSG
ncbi:amidohydrolase family protein [Rhizobium sp. GN54]|uniref:amidohydrolase family protein n=1 Tax=Rhizobium sp. GN54 TaxID=2898150 RepID=UPI001E4B0ED2|nr:amidohydrolase family protein [Rhizobium sp. GN54]MCD2183841.1 amidohydrolase family protein [Rhizobium sp. GN54]